MPPVPGSSLPLLGRKSQPAVVQCGHPTVRHPIGDDLEHLRVPGARDRRPPNPNTVRSVGARWHVPASRKSCQGHINSYADNGGRELRQAACQLGFDYALAVRADHRVDTTVGRLSVTDLATRVPKKNWMRLRTGHGLRGDRHYAWAMLDIHPDDTPDGQEHGHSTVLVRRHRYTRELSYCRCHSALPVTLADLVDVVCCRCRLEEDFQLAKGV